MVETKNVLVMCGRFDARFGRCSKCGTAELARKGRPHWWYKIESLPLNLGRALGR